MNKARILSRSTCVAVALLVTSLMGQRSAHAQQPKVSVSASQDIYAGLPFTLVVSAEGFDEEPAPEPPSFQITGCEITYIGVQPAVSTSTTVFNGRVSTTRSVTFTYRYRVLPEKAGNYQLPAITVTQGTAAKASSRPATFRARDVASSRDMRVELTLPERPVTMGETFDVTLDWYLRKNPADHEFSVPLFDQISWVDVHQPQLAPIQQRDAIKFPAGDRELLLPYNQSEVVLDGLKYTRLRFVVSVTPIKAGTLEIAPTRVVASLRVGTTRDAFGFPSARTELFRAEDKPHTLEIQPLPLKDRPSSFANAVGTGYSIQVRAERTVVALGEPIDLDIVIRGTGRLEGLILPKLDRVDGLLPEQFSVPDAPATGELVDLGQDAQGEPIKGKRFHVVVRIKSPNVREIPAIAFSFYNPETRGYETVRSEPIALSVEGSEIVDATSVVRANPGDSSAAGSSNSTHGNAIDPLVGADLSLSAITDAMAQPWSVTDPSPALYLLYALPLLFLMFRLWQRSTRVSRAEKSAVKQALRTVRQALREAESQPAREAGPRVLSALRVLAKATGHDGMRHSEIVHEIETASYSPKAATEALDRDILVRARNAAEELATDDSKKSSDANKAASLATILASVLLAIGTMISPASGQPLTTPATPAEQPSSTPSKSADQTVNLKAAHQVYQDALTNKQRDARLAGFVRAERMFRQLVASSPKSPALLTDWGNAALGAQELGSAVLAYRRAMALHPRQARARRNLSWVRERLPDWLPKPETHKASDSLFFWHHTTTVTERKVIAACAFAMAILLLAPWGRRRRLLRRLAILPMVIWIAMVLSIGFDSPPINDAVVIRHDVPVRSADNVGSALALGKPLPAGAEVEILETRESWLKITLADGTEGWVQISAVERVILR